MLTFKLCAMPVHEVIAFPAERVVEGHNNSAVSFGHQFVELFLAEGGGLLHQNVFPRPESSLRVFEMKAYRRGDRHRFDKFVG